MKWTFNTIQRIVILFHLIVIAAGFAPSARISAGLFHCGVLTWIWYPCLGLTSTLLYILVCQGPGYAEDYEPMPENDPQYYFCPKCQRSVPLRCVHCNTCNRCCLRKDHHLFFILFLIVVICFGFGAIFMIQTGMQDNISFDRWLYTSLPLSILYYSIIIALIQPFILVPVHIFLACIDMTTREFIKRNQISYLKKWSFFPSPFSEGLFKNLKKFIKMRWTHPLYDYNIPKTDEEIAVWKSDNKFLLFCSC